LKEKTTTQVSLPYLVRHQHTPKPKQSKNKKKKIVSPNSYRNKSIPKTQTPTTFLSKVSGEKKPPKTQNLGGSRKKKSINKAIFFKKEVCLICFSLKQTNKQPTNALASKKERKKER
jgi:hypothetical protein